MKKILVFLLLCNLATAWSQPMPEPLRSKYRAAKTDSEKGILLLQMENPGHKVTPQELQKWFKNNNDPVGADYVGLYLATGILFKGDNAIALDLTFPLLKRFEQRKDDYGIMHCYHIIGISYSHSKKFDLAFSYLKKSIAIAERIHANKFLALIYNDIGVVYSIAELPDQGLEYAQKSVKFAEKYDPKAVSMALSTVGENYMAAKEYHIALPFLRKSRQLEDKKYPYSIAYADNDFTQTFLGLKQYDSAVYYANRSLQTSNRLGFKDQKLRSYEYLVAIFEQTKRPDSLNKYYKLLIQSKDELFSVEKLRSVEASNYKEQLRQGEREAQAAEAKHQRYQNIQYALIATGIITFFIFFLILSRTVIVNEKWISFLAILALLLVFEFINLLIHPFLESITHHSPVLMLLCLVVLASLLIPLHHKLEHFIKHKLTEKNKAIRLAAAKKTIEQLDNN